MLLFYKVLQFCARIGKTMEGGGGGPGKQERRYRSRFYGFWVELSYLD